MEEALRQSRRALLVGAAFTAIGALLLWVATRYWELPAWIAWLVFGFAVFNLLGDALNIVHLTRRLSRRPGSERPGSSAASDTDR